MSLVAFEELPDSARLWCFGSDRAPDARETAHLLESVRAFLEEWAAHGSDLEAGFDWRHQRFLLVGADERSGRASGCSIDDLVRHLRQLGEELDLTLTDRSPVWFRDPERGDRVRSTTRDEFRELAVEGRVGPGTVVFDPTLQEVGALREGAWELPASESWHRRLLPEQDVTTRAPTS